MKTRKKITPKALEKVIMHTYFGNVADEFIVEVSDDNFTITSKSGVIYSAHLDDVFKILEGLQLSYVIRIDDNRVQILIVL
jgi:hypothetical protein